MKLLIATFLGIILGGIAGAAVTLYAYVEPPLYESPKYRMQERREVPGKEILSADPCAYLRTGGYAADPGDPCRQRHSVPEPGTVALMAAGVVVLILWRSA